MEARPTLVPAALAAILDEVPALVAVMLGDDLRVEYANARLTALSGDVSPLHRPAGEVIGQLMGPASAAGYAGAMRAVYETGRPATVHASPVRFHGRDELTYFDIASLPLPGGGGVVLHAVDVTHVVAASKRAELAESRYTALAEAGVVGIAVTRDSDIAEANDAFLGMVGRGAEDVAAGLPWRAVIPEAEWSRGRESQADLERTGVIETHEMSLARPDGTEVTALMTAARLPDGGVVGVFFDVTDRKAAERAAADALERERAARAAAEAATASIARLQEATRNLGSARSVDTAARLLVRHAVEAAGAAAGGGALGSSATDLRIGHAVGLPGNRLDLWRDFPATLPAAFVFAVRTRQPVELVDAEAVEAASPELVDPDVGARAALALPLVADDRVLGALLLTFRSPGLPGGDTPVLLRTLARLGAASLDRALLYEDRAYVAGSLQRGLLPETLPAIDGLDVAVSYHAITGSGEVGGDFYDLFQSAPGRHTVAVGDVSGKGTEAAVVTGLARHTVRAAAQLLDGPAATLGFLNDALRLGVDRPPFCTVACADLTSTDGGWRARISSGGHPFPLVVRAGARTLEEVELTGTMLGVDEDPRLGEADVVLRPGDALVLYTDGITDARDGDRRRFGEERLHRALSLGAGSDAAALVAAVDTAVSAFQPGPAADDRALIVLRAVPWER